MSLRTKKILFLVSLIWFAGVFLAWRFMGTIPETPIKAFELTYHVATMEPDSSLPASDQNDENTGMEKEEQITNVEEDELKDYSPCEGSGTGTGNFGNLSSHYDKDNRFVLFLDFHGSIGDITVNKSLHKRTKNVTFLDFKGDLRFNQEYLRVTPGPVDLVRLGRHKVYTRISINYLERESPQYVQVEQFCKEDSVAIRLTHGDSPITPSEPIVPNTLAPLLPPPLKGTEAKEGTFNLSDGNMSNGDISNGDISDGEESKGTQKFRETKDNIETLNEREADPDNNLTLCQGTENGRGLFGIPEYFLTNTGMAVLRLPLDSEEGPGQIKVGHFLGKRQGHVSYLDFMGNYRIKKLDNFFPNSPFRLVRFGKHRDYTRLSLNYKDNLTLKAAPGIEIHCLQNAVEIRLVIPEFAEKKKEPIEERKEEPKEENKEEESVEHKEKEAGVENKEEAGVDVPLENQKDKGQKEEEKEEKEKEEKEKEEKEKEEKEKEGGEELKEDNPQSTESIDNTEDTKSRGNTESLENSKSEESTVRAESTLQNPIASNDALSPCALEGYGSGAFDTVSVEEVNSENYILRIPFETKDKLGKTDENHVLKTRGAGVSFIDIRGRYRFKSRDLFLKTGSIRLVRFGSHIGFTRLSLNYREGDEPKEVKIEPICQEGLLELKVRLVYDSPRVDVSEDDLRKEEREDLSNIQAQETGERDVTVITEEPVTIETPSILDTTDIPDIPKEEAYKEAKEDTVSDEPGTTEPITVITEKPEIIKAPEVQEESLSPDSSETKEGESLVIPGSQQEKRTMEESSGSSESFKSPESAKSSKSPYSLQVTGALSESSTPVSPKEESYKESEKDRDKDSVLADKEEPEKTEGTETNTGEALDDAAKVTPDGTIREAADGTIEEPGTFSLPETTEEEKDDANVSQGIGISSTIPVTSGNETTSWEVPKEELSKEDEGENPMEIPLITRAEEEARTVIPKEEETSTVIPEEETVKESAFLACEGKGRGNGTFGAFIGKEEKEGVFTLTLPFRGNLGGYKFGNSLKHETGNVTFLDLEGSYRARVGDERLTGGPVGRVRFGFHEDFTRISLNFRNANAPSTVKGELLCRNGEVQIRLTHAK